MKSIWVSGASGILGYSILKAIKSARLDYRIIGTTCFPNTPAPLFCDICIDSIPMTHDPTYFSWVSEFTHKYNVIMAIPGIEVDAQFWTKSNFASVFPGVTFVLNNSDLVNLCSDKYLFYEKLISLCPRYAIPTFTACNESNLPSHFVVKPRNGNGSKGIMYGESWQDYKNIISSYQVPYITQPITGSSDAEFTLSAFYSNESKPLGSMLLRRRLSPQGFTDYAEISDLDTKSFLEDMGQSFSPVGPTNFQFRLIGEKIKLLEINPRLSSATSMRALLGYNEPEMSVNYFLHNKIPDRNQVQSSPVGTRCVRYINDAIIT